MLLEINTDYSIDYRCISSVDKVSNIEYIITKDKDSKVNPKAQPISNQQVKHIPSALAQAPVPCSVSWYFWR